MYAKYRHYRTHLGCDVLEVQSVARKNFSDDSYLLTPTLDITLSGPRGEDSASLDDKEGHEWHATTQ